jgi:hypothetical protein
MNATQPLILADGSPRSAQLWRRLKDRLLTLALAALGVVPNVELILRATLHAGIRLAVGMLGATVATRERRVLTITAFALLIPTSARAPVTAFANALAAAACTLLVAADQSITKAHGQRAAVSVQMQRSQHRQRRTHKAAFPSGCAGGCGARPVVHRVSQSTRGELITAWCLHPLGSSAGVAQAAPCSGRRESKCEVEHEHPARHSNPKLPSSTLWS